MSKEKFDINERFNMVHQCVKAVGSKKVPSVILTGKGGLGKSYTVIEALKAAGLTDYRTVLGNYKLEHMGDENFEESFDEFQRTYSVYHEDETPTYVVIKGYSSTKGLYNTLYDNRYRTVVFDDCDAILDDKNALNILKAALDSSGERWVTWNIDSSRNDDTPNTFPFIGSVVFVSNKNLEQIDPAVRSRSVCLDLAMTTDQAIERMTTVVRNSSFMPTVSIDDKLECLSLIEVLKDQIKEMSMRTLITVIKLHGSCEDWKKVAECAICC